MPRAPLASTKLNQLKRHSFKTLLKVVRFGRPVMDPRTGEQRVDEDGKPVFTPATASDLAQSRILQKELAAEAQQEINNPYADDARGRAKLADALCDRGYSRAEAFEIINGKYKQ